MGDKIMQRIAALHMPDAPIHELDILAGAHIESILGMHDAQVTRAMRAEEMYEAQVRATLLGRASHEGRVAESPPHQDIQL